MRTKTKGTLPQTDLISHTGKPKWVATWAQSIKDVVYGKMLTSTCFHKTTPTIYIEHWIHQPPYINQSCQRTPRSTPNIVVACNGCSLHFPYYIGSQNPKCIIKINYYWAAISINSLTTSQKWNKDELAGININRTQVLKYSHPHYRNLVPSTIHNNILTPATNFLSHTKLNWFLQQNYTHNHWIFQYNYQIFKTCNSTHGLWVDYVQPIRSKYTL